MRSRALLLPSACAGARALQEACQQKMIHRLELLQAGYEGNRLLY